MDPDYCRGASSLHGVYDPDGTRQASQYLRLLAKGVRTILH